jgi:hypothetical protein
VAVAKLLADDRTATNFALPRKMHTRIFKIRRKKFTLAGAFPKESCGKLECERFLKESYGKLGASILGAGLSLSCRAGM